MTRHELRGLIAGVAFASGDRLVVGHWAVSPIGPFSDVMWADPAGVRTLWVAEEAAGRFVEAVYRFDRVEVTDLTVDVDGPDLTASSSGWQLVVGSARRGPVVPVRRPASVTRWIEGPVARALKGVRTYGVSPTGVREWYRADEWRRITSATLTVAGQDRGELVDFDPPARFGFSEPPRTPTVTRVRPLLVDPSGALDRLVDDLRDDR